MGLLIQDRKFFSQIANGEAFGSNLTDKGTHLKGSVMEKVKAVYLMDVFWNSVGDDINTLTFTNVSGFTYVIGQPVNNFIDEGWTPGDLLDLVDSDGTPAGAIEGSVDWVTAQEMQVTFVADITGAGGLTTTLHGKTPLEGFILDFGLLENSDNSINSLSKVTGENQQYSAEGVGNDPGGGRITTFVDCDPLGPFFSWQSGSARIRYVSNPSTYVQRFEMEHIFVILPYYVDGEINSLQAGSPPALFAGIESLKYVIQTEFRNVLSNPNTAKTGTDNTLLGSVGWYNENYNGFPNEYSITSIAYEDSGGNSADGIVVGDTTTVTVVVGSAQGTFVDAASKFGVYHSRLPALDDYTEQAETFTEIWFYEGKIQTVGVGAVAGTILSDISAVFDNANQITITFDVTYSADQQAAVDANDFYVLGIQVADHTKDTI